MPKRPSLPSSAISSRGRIPCSNQSPTSGRTCSRTNERTVSRIARSSSSSRPSIARKSSGSSAVVFSVTAIARKATVRRVLAAIVAGADAAPRRLARPRQVAALTPREKAEAVVVAGMPAGDGFGGVPRPPVEHGRCAPARVARLRRPGGRDGEDVPRARAVARRVAVPERGGGLPRRPRDGARRFGAPACTPTFAPVLDLPDGPLGSRQFAKPEFGVAFARGLGAAPPARSTSPASARRRSRPTSRASTAASASQDLAPFRCAIRAASRASWSGTRSTAARAAAGLVRAEDVPSCCVDLGFRGVAVTDSLGVLGSPYAPFWARSGAAGRRRHGADDERAVTRAGSSTRSLPLARAGELDAKLVRIFRYRRARWRHRDGERRLDGLPAPTARASRLCGPGCSATVFQPSVNGAATSVPRSLPSTRTRLAPHVRGRRRARATRPVTCWPSERVWLCDLERRRGCRLRLRHGRGFGWLTTTGSAGGPRGRRTTWRRPGARACRASPGRAPGEEERRRAVDLAPLPSTRKTTRRRLRAPRPDAQLHRSPHLRPWPRAGAGQRERLVVDDDRRPGDVVAAGAGDPVHLEHVRAVAELRRVQAAATAKANGGRRDRRRGR